MITTRVGAELPPPTLLDPVSGWFHRLRAEHALPPMSFKPEDVHVIPDDLSAVDRNASSTEFVLDLVSQLMRDETRAAHASIGQDSKVMGYHLHYALSVFGRRQDRLTYALPSTERDPSRDLFYPRPGQPADAVGNIELVDISFARLRVNSTQARI